MITSDCIRLFQINCIKVYYRKVGIYQTLQYVCTTKYGVERQLRASVKIILSA